MRGIRRRLLVVVVAGVAAAVAILVVAFNLVLARVLTHDAQALVRSRALAQLEVLHVDHGRLRVGEARDIASTDADIWVFAGRTPLERPHVAPRVDAAARRLAGDGERFVEVRSADMLLYATPVVVRGRRFGTVVAGTSLAPYEKTRRAALIGSLALGAAVLVLVALAARWILASSLRPVRRMTRQAAEWGDHDLDRRFGLGTPHDELTELAATLDGLLDRVAASLRREQRFSAELSHELRTPLARVLGESELALRRPREGEEYRAALEVIHRNARQLTRIVDALVAAARHEAGAERGTADAYAVARDAVAACSPTRLELEVAEPRHPLRVGVDPEYAARVLQPVLENACRYGTRKVTVSIARDDGAIRYAIEDDGPGVRDDERERIFEAGVRGTAADANGAAGSGLGLSLARRLARSVAGDVEAVATSGGGRFVVRLPGG